MDEQGRHMYRVMRDLPGDLGLTVIDELPEMIGWVKWSWDI